MRDRERRWHLALALTAALGACTVAVEREAPSAPADDPVARIDAWAREAVESGQVAGLSVAVRRDPEIVLARGYGHADLENEVPASEHTVYRIGSVTKQFTAAVVMQLVAEGRVDLDADIRDYVDFPTQGQTVTVRQLLDHTSGIPSYTGLGEPFWSRSRLDLSHDQLLGMVRDLPFDFAPGTQWRYNNSGYYLLGVLVENVTGASYEEALQSRLLGPLGLESTTYCDERKLIANRAEGYELADGELVNDTPLSMRVPFAAGALCSTVLDLLAWQRALDSGQVVTPEAYERMVTPGTLADGAPLSYGFGLGVDELEGHRRIQHGGGINGFASMLALYPDDGLRIVVLVNTPGRAAGMLAERIARLLLGLEIEPPDPAATEEADGDRSR